MCPFRLQGKPFIENPIDLRKPNHVINEVTQLAWTSTHDACFYVRPCFCWCLIWVRLRAAQCFRRCWRDLPVKKESVDPLAEASDVILTDNRIQPEFSFNCESRRQAIDSKTAAISTCGSPTSRMWSPLLVVGRCQRGPRNETAYRHYMIQCPASLLPSMWVRELCVSDYGEKNS